METPSRWAAPVTTTGWEALSPIHLVPARRSKPADVVPNIFLAQPGDYQEATQRVYHSSNHASSISLPLVQH
jgi:hypothetical protein